MALATHNFYQKLTLLLIAAMFHVETDNVLLLASASMGSFSLPRYLSAPPMTKKDPVNQCKSKDLWLQITNQ